MTEFTAEVIAIGDEMTSGAKLDTNTQWLCQRLGEIGVTVRYTSMVGDQLGDNVAVFRNASNRVDFVVATGGLGPTADDLTREVIAAVASKPLVLHEPSLRHIESMFASRAREMPPRNRVQAMFPEGAFDIFNPRGTAPGIDMTVPRLDGGKCRFFALPGVPAEMKEMFVSTVAPRILASLGNERPLIRNAVVKCFGIGESDMEARLGEMISRQSSPRVGITVSGATISLRITATGKSEEECSASIDQVRQEIHAKAGEYVFGEGEDFELQDAVMQLLEPVNQRLGTIEVGHAAPLANWLADSLPRGLYAGGLIMETLEMNASEIDSWRRHANADWLLIVDSYPSLKHNQDDAAEIRISIVGSTPERSATATYRLGGHPSIVHSRIGKTGLAFLRKHLLEQTASVS
jgi:nicotinamide-nucleotide amidase